MHVLFVHHNYPAQFGHLGKYLSARYGFECTFATSVRNRKLPGIRTVYFPKVRKLTESRLGPFETFINGSTAVFESLSALPEIEPDLIIGHSGFGTTAFLQERYRVPVISYFEFFYGANGYEFGYREDAISTPGKSFSNAVRNAAILTDLNVCTLGYCPTDWQRSQFPSAYGDKLETIFDGVETEFWAPDTTSNAKNNRKFGSRQLPHDVQIVTYLSRGFERLRGFDVFVESARQILRRMKDVVFVCVGSDRTCYGNANEHQGFTSYREKVLAAYPDLDAENFIFTGRLSRVQLRDLFRISDLHMYITEPFILSWSVVQALACGCLVLGSNTEPVAELVQHGENGLLADFFDAEQFADHAVQALKDKVSHQTLRERGVATVEERYSIDAVLPKMVAMYERAIELHKAEPNGRRIACIAKKDPAIQVESWPEEEPPKAAKTAFHPNKGLEQLLSATPIDNSGESIVLDVSTDQTGESALRLCNYLPSSLVFSLVAPNRGGDYIARNVIQRCWSYRSSLFILRGNLAAALRYLSGEFRQPAIVQLNDGENLKTKIKQILAAAPSAAIFGLDWDTSPNHPVRECMNESHDLDFLSHGSVWRTCRARRPWRRLE